MLNLHLGDALTLLFGVLPWATLVPILWQLLQSLGDLATWVQFGNFVNLWVILQLSFR